MIKKQVDIHQSDSRRITELEKVIKNVKDQNEKYNTRINELKKQLYKFDKNDDISHLNPFEMHQKMRYYENMYEIR